MSIVRFKELYRKLKRYIKNGNKCCMQKSFSKYKTDVVYDGNDYLVLAPKHGSKKVLAIHNDVVVEGNFNIDPTTFFLFPDYNIKAIRYKIRLTKHTFPNLIKDSKITNVVILKYLRTVSKKQSLRSWRLVVFTDKGQIYHNFPNRSIDCAGSSKVQDIILFEESVVWDLPGRQLPSKNERCDELETFNPNLPDSCYEYHPLLNTSKEFVDKYGNGGFGKARTVKTKNGLEFVSRFYIPIRNELSSPFNYMGGFDNSYRMTVLGTYNSGIKTCSRNCIFMSDDGGREWFCKYEFGDLGEYAFLETQGYDVRNNGNPISSNLTYQYNRNDISIFKRNTCIDKFCFEWVAKGNVSSIEKGNPCIVHTFSNHNLKNNEIIKFTINRSVFLKSNLSFNKKDNDCLSTQLFKVIERDETSFYLYEYGYSEDNPIACRHIHHITPSKDGWIIGTGEIYPNGWLLFLKCNESDAFSLMKASDYFEIELLNHSKTSVQRTMGVHLLDKPSQNIIFASDHSSLPWRTVNIPNSSQIERGSTGVFIGNIADLDDFSKFNCLFESDEVSYFFRIIDNIICYGGQLGELSLSKDGGNHWKTLHLRNPLIHLNGTFNGGFVVENTIIIVK